jgi:hypothetical protein
MFILQGYAITLIKISENYQVNLVIEEHALHEMLISLIRVYLDCKRGFTIVKLLIIILGMLNITIICEA